MKSLRSLLHRSRRRVLKGIVLIVLCVLILAYVAPRFSRSLEEVRNTNRTVDPRMPPHFRKILEYEIDQIYEEFYRWSVLLVLACLFGLGGTYLVLTGSKAVALSKARVED